MPHAANVADPGGGSTCRTSPGKSTPRPSSGGTAGSTSTAGGTLPSPRATPRPPVSPGKSVCPSAPKVCSPAWGSILPRAVPCGTAAPLPLPDDWAGAQLALHIGAADQVLDAWGQRDGRGGPHTGGYEAMTFGGDGSLAHRRQRDPAAGAGRSAQHRAALRQAGAAAGRHVVHPGVGRLADRLAGTAAALRPAGADRHRRR